MTRSRAVVLLMAVLLTLAGCQAPPSSPSIPRFGPDDLIRCSSGGGEGRRDEWLLQGNGLLRYTPVKGPSTERRLSPEQTQRLFQDLVSAGLLSLKEEPNRDLERYGILLQAELGDVSLRASIGLLEVSRLKHQSWRQVLDLLTRELEPQSRPGSSD